MSALEQEIIEKFRQLDDEAKQRVIHSLEREVQPPQLSLGEWLEEVQALRTQLTAKYGKDHFSNIQDMLDEIREEASN